MKRLAQYLDPIAVTFITWFVVVFAATAFGLWHNKWIWK